MSILLYAGQNLIGVHIAALGPRPPVPPGLDRLPAAGEMVVSPAQAELLRSIPDDQLVLTALAVCLITWPLMDVVTRHDNVRFE
jgi:hypothetical protein